MIMFLLEAEEMHVHYNKELEDFAVTNMVDNPIQYVNDNQASQCWNDLTYNSIVTSKPMTSTVLACILVKSQMQPCY